jgi:hypothetical protein
MSDTIDMTSSAENKLKTRLSCRVRREFIEDPVISIPEFKDKAD